MRATCGGIRIWPLYVPNGRTPYDPHFAYKLAWLAALLLSLEAQTISSEIIPARLRPTENSSSR